MLSKRVGMLVALIAVLAAAGAEAQRNVGEPFILAPGESELVGPYGLRVGFDAVLADSRCPSNVVCIWQGDASALLWARRPMHLRQEFDLHTHWDFRHSAEYGPYVIQLLEVKPYPTDPGVPIPEDYRVTIVVNAELPLTSRDTTWSRIKVLYGLTP